MCALASPAPYPGRESRTPPRNLRVIRSRLPPWIQGRRRIPTALRPHAPEPLNVCSVKPSSSTEKFANMTGYRLGLLNAHVVPGAHHDLEPGVGDDLDQRLQANSVSGRLE